ncbi:MULTISPECIES: Panacea domain-containing protein [Streptomyces]|uniref:Panacea domain-containing protein n=2 Tax=Streptomyces TaxID=1883 RepID=A0ABV9JAA3_9ACTN
MASVHDVAAYILTKHGAMSAMKLQKLCYYAQAWSLAWDQAELFPEDFQAWANGPVARDLYNVHRGQFSVTAWPQGNPDNLTDEQRTSVDAVLDAYGKHTAQQLSELTHREQPWRTARGSLPEMVRSDAVISKESMQDFYASLITRDDAEDV